MARSRAASKDLIRVNQNKTILSHLMPDLESYVVPLGVIALAIDRAQNSELGTCPGKYAGNRDPLRSPVFGIEQTHLPMGGLAPVGGPAFPVPNSDLPEAILP